MVRRILRKLLQSRVARRILAAVLAVVVAELSDAGSSTRSPYGNSPYDDSGVHSRW